MNLSSTKFVPSVIEEGIVFNITLPCFRVGNFLNIKSGTAVENRWMKTLIELLLEERKAARGTDLAEDGILGEIGEATLEAAKVNNVEAFTSEIGDSDEKLKDLKTIIKLQELGFSI